jgi:hypothetical protein
MESLQLNRSNLSMLEIEQQLQQAFQENPSSVSGIAGGTSAPPRPLLVGDFLSGNQEQSPAINRQDCPQLQYAPNPASNHPSQLRLSNSTVSDPPSPNNPPP